MNIADWTNIIQTICAIVSTICVVAALWVSVRQILLTVEQVRLSSKQAKTSPGGDAEQKTHCYLNKYIYLNNNGRETEGMLRRTSDAVVHARGGYL